MAIYTIKDRTKEHVKQLLEDVGNVCFYCWGDLFDDPEHSTGGVVVWMGPNAPIALHQPCAEKLALDLIQESSFLKQRTGIIAKLEVSKPEPIPEIMWYLKNTKGD